MLQKSPFNYSCLTNEIGVGRLLLSYNYRKLDFAGYKNYVYISERELGKGADLCTPGEKG